MSLELGAVFPQEVRNLVSHRLSFMKPGAGGFRHKGHILEPCENLVVLKEKGTQWGRDGARKCQSFPL